MKLLNGKELANFERELRDTQKAELIAEYKRTKECGHQYENLGVSPSGPFGVEAHKFKCVTCGDIRYVNTKLYDEEIYQLWRIHK